MVIHQNWTSIKVRNEGNVIEPHKYVNMIILETSPNHLKSLNLGSRDSFSSNFTIFEKIALCGLRWLKLNVSKCQKDVKCQIVKHLDYGGGSQKR